MIGYFGERFRLKPNPQNAMAGVKMMKRRNQPCIDLPELISSFGISIGALNKNEQSVKM